MEKVSAVIVAGGSGKRMNSQTKKQFIKLQDKMILAYALEAFQKAANISEIIVVVAEEDKEEVIEKIIKPYNYSKVKHVVNGGKERQDSVYNGLMKVAKESEYVMIHDGARPFISQEIINKALLETKEKKATIVAVKVKDTIKVIGEKGEVISTPNREMLWSVQTPQSFEKQLIIKAYNKAREEGLVVTDDSMVVEHYGHQVYLVEGDYCNIKITTKEDLVAAEAILKAWKQ